ncbi:MAG TPA: extracellular solute-binding protein [bacterium]|nr:extracellular solute-binding protein [bacterium]
MKRARKERRKPANGRAVAGLSRRTLLTAAAGGAAALAAGVFSSAARTAGVRAAAPTTLQFWYVRYTIPLLNELLDGFGRAFEQSHPGVRVQVQAFPFGEYFQKVNVAYAGNQAPDVFFVDFPLIPNYVYRKMIVPLDGLVAKAELDDYYPAPRNDMTYQGKVWALPMHQSGEQLLYNVDVLDQAKIRPPHTLDQEWTKEDFLHVAEAVVRRDAGRVTRWAYATTYAPGLYVYQPWLAMSGGEVLSPDASRATGYLNSPATVNAFTFWGDLYTKRQLAPIQPTPDLFGTGQTAFTQGNPFVLRDIAARFSNLRVGATFMPRDRRCVTNSGAYHIGISVQAKQRDLAWEFVNSVAGRDGHLKWVKAAGYLPALKSTYAELPYLKQYPWSVFWDGLAHCAVQRPRTPAYDFVDDTVTQASKDIQLGRPVKPILDVAAAKIDQELARYR